MLSNEALLEGLQPVPRSVLRPKDTCPAVSPQLSQLLWPGAQSPPPHFSPEYPFEELVPGLFLDLIEPRGALAPLSSSVPVCGVQVNSERLNSTYLFHFMHIEFGPLEPHIQRICKWMQMSP